MQYEARMSHHALETLVEQIRSLPGTAAELGLPRAAVAEAATPPVVSLAAFTLATASRSVHAPSPAVVSSAVLLTVIGTGFEAGPAVLTPVTRNAGSWADAAMGPCPISWAGLPWD